MKVLPQLARLSAILAGLLMTSITLLTCGNLVLRNLTDDAIPGAFEMTAVATGAAIALFMPLCQIRQGNIIVDFFTSNCSQATTNALDRIGALVLSAIFALLAWRTVIGGLSAYNANAATMLMGIPEWIVYAAMVPPFTLTAVIGFTQAVVGFDAVKERH
ncbi:MAG: TRAP transporter small permease [Burkholderiaceae bacterium]